MAFARLQILPKEPLKMRCGNQHLGSKNWKFTKQQIRWFANQAVGGFTDLPTVPAASGRYGSLKTAATEFWFLWKYPAKCTIYIYIQYIYSIYTVYIQYIYQTMGFPYFGLIVISCPIGPIRLDQRSLESNPEKTHEHVFPAFDLLCWMGCEKIDRTCMGSWW